MIQTYPQDRTSYTEGLQMVDGVIYEGTGLYGQSKIRKWDLRSGRVLTETHIGEHYFGEGVTVLDHTAYELTYIENTGYTYDKDTLRPKGSFRFPFQVEQATYIDRLRERLRQLVSPGITVDVHGISPPDRFFHPITEFRCAEQTIRAGLEAERGGYDAFVIGHFQEPGLTECRGALDIPVIGLGEATMLFACSIGRKIGLVTMDPVFIPWHDEQIVRHGLSQRVGGVAAIKADLPRFMRAFTDAAEYALVRDDFVRQVQPLLERGCDVLIPAGGLPMLLFARQQPFLIERAVVLEGIATVIKAAEMALALHDLTGVAASRRGLYSRAPEGAIADFLARSSVR